MRARYHGESAKIEEMTVASADVALGEGILNNRFGYMFEDLLEDPHNFLPENSDTISALRMLGEAMGLDPSSEESNIPAAYTYFGQFIDHDITNTVFRSNLAEQDENDDIFNVIDRPDFTPLNLDQIQTFLINDRTCFLELDSVYSGLALEQVDAASGKMNLDDVTEVAEDLRPIKTDDLQHDLPRRPMIPNPNDEKEEEQDRQALIGDPRNDENLIIAQMHVAFLRSHNALLDRDRLDFEATKKAIRRRYQWAVLHDFLPRICKKEVIEEIVKSQPKYWKVIDKSSLFIPVEFSGAAYRFGHSMVRQEYDYNSTFNPNGLARATFNFMFTFTALSGSLSPVEGKNTDSETLPNNWIIDWARFFNASDSEAPILNPARRIDTHLAPELNKLPNLHGVPITNIMGKLAARNLLRGYLLRLPTGQAVARKIGTEILPEETLLNAVPESARDAFKSAGFLDKTPLWFYILAEAEDVNGPNGQTLGSVGSQILGETFWNLIFHSEDSVLQEPPSEAELATGDFSLKGIIKIGQDKLLTPLE